MQKWEYLIFREYKGIVAQINDKQEPGLMARMVLGHGTRPQELLNRLGQDGWELVGLGLETLGGLNYVLKRPIE